MSNHSFNGEVADGHMGLMTSYRWRVDPKSVLFMLARYKFVAKMLEGKERVLEIGCGDAFGSRIVASVVGHLDCYDQDRQMIESAAPMANISYYADRFTYGEYDAAYALDVVEHNTPEEMRELLRILKASSPIVIIGSPSKESQVYASPLSAQNHINCMTGPELKAAMARHFRNVLLLSMNDEIIGTGFSPMSHYNIAIGI